MTLSAFEKGALLGDVAGIHPHIGAALFTGTGVEALGRVHTSAVLKSAPLRGAFEVLNSSSFVGDTGTRAWIAAAGGDPVPPEMESGFIGLLPGSAMATESAHGLIDPGWEVAATAYLALLLSCFAGQLYLAHPDVVEPILIALSVITPSYATARWFIRNTQGK